MSKKTTLIIGANSEIAKALALLIINTEYSHLIIVSRDTSFYQQNLFNQSEIITITNYNEDNICNIVQHLKHKNTDNIFRVFICNGLLHSNNYQPEKCLEDFSAKAYATVIEANTVTPMLWLKHLTPILTGNENCKVTIFTARVGSISDNKLGGWYSYRSAKAAMNMLIKSAAVELARRAKNIKLISFHPGTTDTPLSKPFQKNVPEGKLFTSDFVAKNLLEIVTETPIDGKASFLDWQGIEIPW
jgi:NAD(P)-dependent dehydrogenase (short-subunit alcohol dehydrogenase family)